MPKEITVKSVLNKLKKRDSWFLCDYSVNLYSSCSFNCLYCYIRGSKYGSNLAESLSVKINSLEILERQLFNRAKKEQYGIIVLSSATDPYLPVEEKYQLTREALKLILKYKFPVHIITKSDLLERDFDLLTEINHKAILPVGLQSLKKGVIISFSFSTLSDDISRIFEPGTTIATKPDQRLIALKNAIHQKFHAGVSLMPLLPFISDTAENLNHLFSTFQTIGVAYILPATLTLHGTGKAASKTLVLNAIRRNFPELEQRYINYFKNGSEMPAYYQKAFYAKMKELSHEYGIPDSILNSGITDTNL